MNPAMSVMKTFVMIMGEFEAKSLVAEMANSLTFFCLFAVFVVIIAMVLLNSLTGLAVSDTQAIKSDAEELSVVSHIRLNYEIESTLFQWYTFVEKWPTCTLLYHFITLQKSNIKNSILFPGTSYKERILVLPNKGPNIFFEGDGLIIGEATRIISKRSEPDVNNMKENFSQIQEALKENESKIENKMDTLFKKLSEEIRCYQRRLERHKIQTK
jgi:hypothetical protein